MLCGKAGSKPSRLTDAEKVANLLVREATDDGSSIRYKLNESVGCKASERLAPGHG